MTLQDKLDAFKVEFETKLAPAPAVEAFHRSTQDLIDRGLADGALKAGQVAPDFVLKDPDGNDVSSRELLAKGPVVLTFYRGVWCPYCNMELQALQEALPEIKARGAQLVAISLQGPENSRKSQRDNKLDFPILTDQGGDVSEEFGLKWTLQDFVIPVFQGFKVELPTIHGTDDWTLPMPARYILDTDGTIAYAEVNPDYTIRPEPSDMFPVLDKIARVAA